LARYISVEMGLIIGLRHEDLQMVSIPSSDK